MSKTRNLQLTASILRMFFLDRAINEAMNRYRGREPEYYQMSIEDYFPRWEEGDYE